MTTIDFTLRGDFIALHQLLKLTGLCPSGGSAKLAVAAGQVCVDGQMETRKARKIRAGQEVRIDNAVIRVRAE
ncbi:MAG TPA: RNA-binding S4 domain-containing protein [Rhodanobacteraceae bacterium]